MRVVSVGAGLLTVLVVGLLGWRFGGGLVGLVAAGLCVVVPFFVVHDGIGIMEPLVTLVMAAALLLQLELARRPDLRVAVLLGLVLAAGVLLKESTKPALALVPLSLLCFDWSAPGRRRRLGVWAWGVGLAALMVVAAELVLRSSSRYEQLLEFREGVFYTVRSLSDALAQPGVGWDTTWPVYRPALVEYVTPPLLGAALAGAVLGLWHRRRLTLLLLGWVAVPFAVAVLFTTLPFPRHIMYVLPPAIVLMAYALVQAGAWLARSLPPRAATPATIAAAGLLLAPALSFDTRVLADPATTKYPGGDDRQYVTGDGGGAVWPAVADAIRRRGRGRRVVILHPRANVDILGFLLGPDSRYEFVQGSSPLASRAQLAVYDETPFVDELADDMTERLGLEPVQRFSRPRGGATVTLYGRPDRPTTRDTR
jgi:4-amino-4-deoxy-L-arabinose transferase-like glycosyltransferase